MLAAVFEKANDVYHLLVAADPAADALDRPLHGRHHLRPAIRLLAWLRHFKRCGSHFVVFGRVHA